MVEEIYLLFIIGFGICFLIIIILLLLGDFDFVCLFEGFQIRKRKKKCRLW